MELQTAIEILEYHQRWRLGKREDMIHDQKKLTEALDIVLSEVKKFCLGAVAGHTEQLVCEYCNEDAKPTCCDSCLESMVNAVQKAN